MRDPVYKVSISVHTSDIRPRTTTILYISAASLLLAAQEVNRSNFSGWRIDEIEQVEGFMLTPEDYK